MRIIHIGDCHLGNRHLGLVEREDDFQKAVRHVVDEAIRTKADVMIWPGDIFDAKKPPAEAVWFLQDAVADLAAAGCVSVGIDGNHDRCDGRWLQVVGITELHLYGPTVIKGVTFIGTSYTAESELSRLLGERLPPADVMVFHAMVDEYGGFCRSPLSREALVNAAKKSGVKYVALGDIHHFHLYKEDNVQICYPGSVELCSMDEPAEKWFVEIDTEKNYEATPKPIPGRKFQRVKVDSEQDLSNMLEVISAAPDSFFVIEVLDSLPDGIQRCRQLLKDRTALYRVDRVSAAASSGLDPEAPVIAPWERSDSVINLHKYVEQTHAADSIEYELIVKCLARPDSIEATIREFLQQRNIEVKK